MLYVLVDERYRSGCRWLLHNVASSNDLTNPFCKQLGDAYVICSNCPMGCFAAKKKEGCWAGQACTSAVWLADRWAGHCNSDRTASGIVLEA